MDLLPRESGGPKGCSGKLRLAAEPKGNPIPNAPNDYRPPANGVLVIG